MNILSWLKKVNLFKNFFLYKECLFLLKFILNKDVSWIIVNNDYILTSKELEILNIFFIKRLRGEPIYYILRRGFFLSFSYIIYPDIFIPRSDTEIMVEYVINLIKINNFFEILDLGTGVGVISLSIAKEFKYINITAIDINLNSINLAKYNSLKLNLHNINFFKSYWFSKISKNKFFDIIVSNPPYIDKNDFCLNYLNDLRFESYDSLVSKNNGLYDIIYIIYNSYFYLKNKGWLIIEHSFSHCDIIRYLFSKLYFNVFTYKDYTGNNRFTVGQKNT